MNDGKAALIGAVAGAVLTGATAFWTMVSQNSATREKDLNTEKRQKLESLLENVAKINQCTFSYLREVTREAEPDRECESFAPQSKAIALSELYFPTMKQDVMQLVGGGQDTAIAIAKCANEHVGPDNRLKKLICVKKLLEPQNDDGSGKRLEKIYRLARDEISKLQ